MSKSRRKFTAEERLSIVQEAELRGRIETIRKYIIASSLYDRWRKKYLAEGINGLKPKYKQVDPQVKEAIVPRLNMLFLVGTKLQTTDVW